MEVTTDMLFAAIKQAVKEGLEKSRHMPIEEYEKRIEAWERVLKAAIDASKKSPEGLAASGLRSLMQ